MDEENLDFCKTTTEDKKYETIFKKPVLVGKIGRLPKKLPTKVVQNPSVDENIKTDKLEETDINKAEFSEDRIQIIENSVPLPYIEPPWSGLPQSKGKAYIFEVLKNGTIIDTINLMSKAYWIFGRLANCDVCMQHPTISRYHAVLQYRKVATNTDGPGFYIYDLDSTHGTFLNKNRLKSKVYVRMQVGHMLKLGCSTRSYILNGPDYDAEEESEYSVTDLKQKRQDDLLKREENKLGLLKELEEKKKKEQEKGVDWGLGEDADEETDLSENPYAQTNNEELYLDDPKKALRGFFEREGLNFDYDCNEQGMGQFLCRVELPLDDEMGRPIVAEVLHKGKKKEAVIQCALEACRILDRYGVLRQATHESRKRKAKNWEENDYYDSDEDTFLDRTGSIEKKREKRMNAKAPQKIETYESLMEKEKLISKNISELEIQLSLNQAKNSANQNENNEEDPLDTFMKGLTDTKTNKRDISGIKMEVSHLRAEHTKIIKLIKIAKPANLPPLSVPSTSQCKSLSLFGKRKKIEIKFEDKYEKPATDDDEDDEEIKNDKIPDENRPSTSKDDDSISSTSSSDEENLHNIMTFKKFEIILKKGLPAYAGKYQEKLEKILNNLKKLATSEDRMHIDWKILSAKKKKVMKLISDMKNDKFERRISSELNRILSELNTMTEQKYKVLDKVKRMGNEIQNISEAIKKDFKYNEPTSSLNVSDNRIQEEDVLDERKKKKNQKRIHYRQEKVEEEKRRGYEEDASREDYNMWVPPTDQTGDGKTSLNDKFGY